MENSWRHPRADSGWLVKTVWLLGLLTLAVAAGLRLPALQYLMYLFLLVVALAGTTVLLVIHRISILPLSFLVLTAVLLPFSLIDRGGSSIPSSFGMVAVLLGVLLIEIVGNQRTFIPVPRRVAIPLFMFLGVAVLSLVVGQFPWFAVHGAPLDAQLAGLAIFLLSGGAFVLFATRLNKRQQIERITWIFLLAGGLTTLLQFFPRVDRILAFAPGSTGLTEAAHIGCLFWTWLVAMGAGQALMNGELRLVTRVGLALGVGLVLFHSLVLNAGWTSGWLPALISLGIVLLLKFPRLTICLGLISLPLVLLSTGIFDSFWGNEGYSFSTRVAAWQVLGSIFARSPLIGLGPANYYYYTSLFPILGWYVTFSSHNNFVDIICQTGLVGFGLFWWFMIEMGFLVAGTYRKARRGFDVGFAAGTLAGLVASLAACMLGDWLIPFVYNVGLRGFRSSALCWIFLGAVVALRRVIDRPAVEGGDLK